MKNIEIGFMIDGSKFFCGMRVDGVFYWDGGRKENSFTTNEAMKYRLMYKMIHDVFRTPTITDRTISVAIPKFSEFDAFKSLSIVFGDLGLVVASFNELSLVKQQRVIDEIKKSIENNTKLANIKAR